MNILSFSGFIPEQICDTKRFFQYAGDKNIAHYCGYAADFISQVLQDASIDGAVFPRTCDSSRAMSSYLAGSGKFTYQLPIPARQGELAAQYLAASIKGYKQAVEAYYGIEINDIVDRAERINSRNRKLAEIYDNLAEISFAVYLKQIHELLQRPLADQAAPVDLPAKAEGPRIYLVGSLLGDVDVASRIEAAGLNIVGDRLTESKRLFSAPLVTAEGDIYLNIAKSMLRNPSSPSQNNFAAIIKEDLNEIKQKAVRGVIFATQKYCEPYDYLFSVYKKVLDEQGIPMLRLVLNGAVQDARMSAMLESFAEIV